MENFLLAPQAQQSQLGALGKGLSSRLGAERKGDREGLAFQALSEEQPQVPVPTGTAPPFIFLKEVNRNLCSTLCGCDKGHETVTVEVTCAVLRQLGKFSGGGYCSIYTN